MDVDERIRTGLMRLQPDEVSATPVPQVAARVRRRRRRRRTAVAGAAVAAGLVATAGTVAVLTADRPTRITSGPTTSTTGLSTLPPSTGETPPATQDGWIALPGAPLESRANYATAVAGERLLVWGGRRYVTDEVDIEFSDGAVLDLTSDTWTPVPAAPLAWSPQPRAVAIGEDVMVISGSTAAVYSPASNTWTALPPHGAPFVSGAVWTGTQLILAPAGPAYSVPDREWQPILAPPRSVAVASDGEWQAAVWTGEEMVVIDQRAAAYDPDFDIWRELTAHPLANDHGYGATWDGRRVVVVEQFGRVAAYDPTSDTWAELTRIPLSSSICRAEVHHVAGVLVVRLCSGDALSADGLTWSPFVAPEIALGFPAAVDGTALYTMSARLRPAPPAADGSTGLAVPLADNVELGGELRPRQVTVVTEDAGTIVSELRAVVTVGSDDCDVRAGSNLFARELDIGQFDQITHLAPVRVTDEQGTWLAGGKRDARWAVQCPSEADAIELLQRIQFRGEATPWSDVSAETFDELKALESTANPSSVEQMFAGRLVEIEARGGGEPSLAYIDYELLLGIGGIGDDTVAYREYLFELDGDGLLAGVQVRTVCARGLAGPDSCV